MRRFFISVSIFSCLFILFSCGREKRDVAFTDTLVIVHFNDTHSQLRPFKNRDGEIRGGISRRRTLVNSIRKEHPNFLLIDAGDFNTGSVYSVKYRGVLDIKLMNLLDYSFVTIGNHEFDFGVEHFIEKQYKAANFPIVSANIYDKKSGERAFTPYIITNIAGSDIVIAGLLTSDLGVMNREVREYYDVVYELSAVSNLIYDLQLKRTNDMFILVTHSGFDTDRKIAEHFPDVDFIIGGHSHTRLTKPVTVKDSDTAIVQAGQWGEDAAFLEILLNKGKPVSHRYKLIPVDDSIALDKEIEAILDKKDEEINREMDVVIAKAEIDLERPILGNIIADSYIWKIPDLDIAMMNAGGVRASVSKGEIKVRDIHIVSPFDNVIMTFEIKGSVLKDIFKLGLTKRYIYYSKGVKVVMKDGEIVEASLHGKPIEDDKYYKVACSDFLYYGGDDMDMLVPNAKNVYDTSFPARETLVEYVRHLKTLNANTVQISQRAVKQ